jgi:putative nucleotidyltransferase with HDIG domain
LDGRRTAGLIRFLPHVALATLLVAVMPVAAVWGLRAAGVLDSVILSAVLTMALALGASYLGSLAWSSRSGSRDLLFSELIVWGWLRRLWIERRLSRALQLLEDDTELGAERRGALLSQLATALESRDPYTHGHSRRVARHAAMIAKRMGLSRHDVANVRGAAMVHDVGKMSTPGDVLHKPGKLSDAEFDVIKEHPVRGAEMVSKLGNNELTAMVRGHHERIDGSGYPDGLSGDAIPLGARIIAVADTFDAITSTRPYRAPRTHRQAIAILHKQAGRRLDADAVRAFQSHYSGRRPVAAWVALASAPERLLALLGGGASVATGSAARVVAASALTGAAAVTAAVDTPKAVSPLRPSGRVHVISTASGTSVPGSSGQALALSATHAHFGALILPAQAHSLLIAQRQGRLSTGPAAGRLVGAVGVASGPTGSAGRGLGQVGVGGQARSEGTGGQGGQAMGSGRALGTAPGLAVGGPTDGAGGADQTQGPGAGSRGQGSAEATPIESVAGSQGSAASSQSPTTLDGQASSPPAAQTTAPSNPPATTPVDGGASTPADGQTPPPADAPPTPPTDGQASTQTDGALPGPNAGTAGGSAPAGAVPVAAGQVAAGSAVTVQDSSASAS